MTCPCGNNVEFDQCCKPLLLDAALPKSAEQLMRSRYTAYVQADAGYLLRTTHPQTRRFHKKEEVLQWSTANTWLRLEILSSKKEFVHFKAYFRDSLGNMQIHEELSRFKKEHGRWYYLDAKY
jgi:SEC-C motif-containing protein